MAKKKETKEDYLADLVQEQHPIPYRIGEEATIKTDSGVTKVSKEGNTVSDLKPLQMDLVKKAPEPVQEIPEPVQQEPNLDDLIKKKQLELLTREVDNTGRAPAENNNNWIADALTAASPALVSWAIGGTHNAHVREFDKGNKYLQQRYNTDKVREIDVDGKPQFIRQQDSIGMQPYKTPPRPVFEKGSGTGKDGKPKERGGSFSSKALVHNVTGKKIMASHNNHTGHLEAISFDKEGNEVRTKIKGSDYSPATKDDVRSTKTAQGGMNIYKVPGVGVPSKIVAEKGEGDLMGGLTSREVGSQVKQAEVANKVIMTIADIDARADMAIKVLSDPNASPSQLASANQMLLKAIEPHKLSDKDFVNLSGERYRDYGTLFDSFAARKFDGTESFEVRQDMIKNAQALKELNRTNLKHVQDNYLPKKGTVSRGRIDQNVGSRVKFEAPKKEAPAEFRFLSPAEMDSLSPSAKKEYLNAFRKYKGL